MTHWQTRDIGLEVLYWRCLNHSCTQIEAFRCDKVDGTCLKEDCAQNNSLVAWSKHPSNKPGNSSEPTKDSRKDPTKDSRTDLVLSYLEKVAGI